MKINCPKCNEETEFFTHNSISEDGEVYMCQHCGCNQPSLHCVREYFSSGDH